MKPHERLLDELVALLEPLRKSQFEQKLNGAVAVIPFEEAVQRILLPLQRRVGDLWHEGRINVAVEHYVTKLIQQKLFSVINQLPVNELGPDLPPGDLFDFCERIKPDLVLLSLTGIKPEPAAHRLLQQLEPISARWPVAVGGQGARAIAHLLRSSSIEFIDDLTVLHNRLMALLSTRMLASQG
jgi:methanogenic corrinoid protein MtbC1